MVELKKGQPLKCRRLNCVFAGMARTTSTGLPPAAVYLVPVPIFGPCTLKKIGFVLWDLGTGGNVILGAYADNGDKPDGGAVLAETPNTVLSLPNLRVHEIAVTDVVLDSGVIWVAFEPSSNSPSVMVWDQETQGGTLGSRYYDRAGGYGALTNPCPVTAAAAFPPIMHIIITGP